MLVVGALAGAFSNIASIVIADVCIQPTTLILTQNDHEILVFYLKCNKVSVSESVTSNPSVAEMSSLQSTADLGKAKAAEYTALTNKILSKAPAPFGESLMVGTTGGRRRREDDTSPLTGSFQDKLDAAMQQNPMSEEVRVMQENLTALAMATEGVAASSVELANAIDQMLMPSLACGTVNGAYLNITTALCTDTHTPIAMMCVRPRQAANGALP